MTGNAFHKSLAALALALAAAPVAYAQEVKPMFKAGFDFGGDTIVSVGVASSTGSSSDSIKANEGVYIGGGASIVTDAKDIEVQVAISYKFSGITAGNGDVDWKVLPLDVLAFYCQPKFRVGGGLTYHLNPTLKGSGAASDLHANYKDALGFVLQADYRFSERAALGARFTSVNYKAESVQASSTIVATTPATNPKSSGLGVTFSMSF